MPPCGPHAAACLLLVLLGLLSCLQVATARPAPAAARPHPPDGAAWRSFKHLLDARRGSRVAGLAELKKHLARFGYMHPRTEHDDAFDEHMEAAVKRYQSRLSLPVTGHLDPATLGRIMSPRCGVADGHGVSVSLSKSAVSQFTFLDGEPRWTRPDLLVLTYYISRRATVDYLPQEDVRAAFRSAFARWARVIPVEFVETDDYYGADIRVGFYEGDHGDNDPFDGPQGVLAHAGGPNDGGLHLDAAEHWTVDLDADTASMAIDLESVATHEIGHVLGLEHSSLPEAVMYPYIGERERKVELTDDDVEGVQLLYGSNPRFRHVPSVSPGRSSWLAGSVSLFCVVLVMLVTHM
ncbi:metalloendoproteinase 1-MMP-like [Phragmites australis]|uniref:metalloendoproteinase 1-MMP-like n=1 Tax=Phragmites australis TaxID=29695 RepID=UPI002D7854EF|nr:metalloendoproteinase 1-MMP-like [Phragmites australis]